MGTGEDSKTAKPVKVTSSTQETAVAPSYPDWSSMQAYYGAAAVAAPPFYATTVTPPTNHPYLWGGQHAMMPPYGTPVSYPALYPHGGIYPHPSTAQIPTMQQTIAEMESRAAADGRDQTATKKSKGTSGTTLVGSTSKGVETGNTASGSGNDGATESAESGSEDSSDTNENLQEEHGTAISKKGSFHQMLVEGASAQNAFNNVNAIGGGPPTLNIGMDLWNASAAAAGGAVNVRPNNHPIAVAPGGGMNASNHWIQDDREMKRQKRKQSNRESARRSRLRKQAECEELQTKVESITAENLTLREELRRLSEECERLASENKSMKEELTAVCGNGAMSKLGSSNGSHKARSRSDKGNN